VPQLGVATPVVVRSVSIRGSKRGDWLPLPRGGADDVPAGGPQDSVSKIFWG
jgi:hypothetical protein